MPNDQKKPPLPPVAKHEEAKFLPPPDTDESQNKGVAPAAPVANSITAAEYEKLADSEKWQILVKAFQLNRRSLLSIPGVTAVDIGYRIEDGSFMDELGLRVHVKRKFPDSAWRTRFKDRPYDFIPNRKTPPPPKGKEYFKLKDYEVPLDVIEGNYRPFQLAGPPRPAMALEKLQEPGKVNARRRLDPLVGGISIGSPQTPTGTLGALVWDNTDGSVCILSNWHVLSGDFGAEAGTPCCQPGRLDQGRSSDVIAHLKRWSFDSQTDAAIAELNGSRHYCAGEILTLPQQISGETAPHLGMLVQKYGRSTGFTWGFVDGLYFSSTIEYNNGFMQVFEDQIHIAPAEKGSRISDPGDSGAVWVSEEYKAVGLHFAGDLPQSAFGEYALANPMSIVMKNLSFSFRPGFLEIRDEDVLPPPPLPVQERGGGPGMLPARMGRRLDGSSGQPDPIQVGPPHT